MLASPPTRRDDLVESLHGHEVHDPYRWLEAPANDPDVRGFIAAQNERSASYLATLPSREPLARRLRALWDHPRLGAPWRRGTRWFQTRNDGMQDQDVVWSAPAEREAGTTLPPEERWSVLLDPNRWSDDGTASLAALAATDDGSLLAFARSEAGSDWMTWQVVDTATGEVLPDHVPWAKFSGAAWLPDSSGFVYGAYEPPEPGHEHDAPTRDHRLLLHRLGTPAGTDALVYARPDQPEWGFSPQVTHDGAWLVIQVERGTDPTSGIHIAALHPTGDAGNDETDQPASPDPSRHPIGEVRTLLDDGQARFRPLGVHGGELYVETDLDAPLGRVLAIDLEDAGRRREVIAEQADRLEAVQLVGGADANETGWMVCRRLSHATSRLHVHDLPTGDHRHDIVLPGPGSVDAVTGGRHDDTIHLTFATFSEPHAVFAHHLDDRSGAVATVARPQLPGAEAAGEIVVEQVHIHHDDVAVPLFLVRRADIDANGTRPTILWGYGGFDIPVTPRYQPAWRTWVEAGGVLAVACLRGGGEYGKTWYDDGRLRNKQHVFDDALACAAWLSGRRRDTVRATALTSGTDADAVWTAPQHLGIEGRSNGGLLVGACLTQEPTAFGSAVPEVGVFDLVRFHRFTIGWAWTSDFGSPDDPDDLAVLLRYSPYHRLEPGTAYPPTLLTTGDTDDRVVPAHSFKFAAALQAAQGGDAPILLRVDTSAGHGAGKPVSKLIDERADVLAFHAHHLGLRVPS